MKRILYMLCAMVLAVGTAQAQQRNYSYALGGSAFTNDALSTSDFFSLSQQQFHFASARSMAMAGAFTSLGADMASLSYNPAGVGMYQRNEVSMSFGLGVSSAKSYNAFNSGDNSNTRAAANSLGASFKIYESSGKLTAVNFAFAYNKIADYNYDITYNAPSSISSAADAFADIVKHRGAAQHIVK